LAVKLVDKVLGFIGFEEDNPEEEEKNTPEEVPEGRSWLKKKEKEKDRGAVLSLHSQRQVRVVVAETKCFDDVKGIADNLKSRRPVIINLEQADAELAKRVVDFISGAAYALNGSFQKVGHGIFLVVPDNIDIASEMKDFDRGKGTFSWMRG